MSIDPTDSPDIGDRSRKNSYVKEYGKPDSAGGFHFLVGRQAQIEQLAAAVGFRYQPPRNGQFAHPAMAMVITPEGKISRYLVWARHFPSRRCELSLVEASQGKIGTSWIDQILLICLHWDPTTGKYSWAAMNLMRVGGIVTLIVLGGAVFWMVKRGSHASRLRRNRPGRTDARDVEHSRGRLGREFWMPPQASEMAGEVDWLFFFIFWICVFFFLLVLVLLVGFAWKYRYREGQPMLDAPKHNTALELTWTFIPTLIVIVIFFYGFKGYMHMVVPPPDSYEVDVTAHMWDYTFMYPNGQISDDSNMHIPVDTPVVFVMSSTDVLHGFYMPVFRIKKDVVPGRYNKIWVQATHDGDVRHFLHAVLRPGPFGDAEEGDRAVAGRFREMGEQPGRRQHDAAAARENTCGTPAGAAPATARMELRREGADLEGCIHEPGAEHGWRSHGGRELPVRCDQASEHPSDRRVPADHAADRWIGERQGYFGHHCLHQDVEQKLSTRRCRPRRRRRNKQFGQECCMSIA